MSKNTHIYVFMFPEAGQEEDNEQRLRSSEVFTSLTKIQFSTDAT